MNISYSNLNTVKSQFTTVAATAEQNGNTLAGVMKGADGVHSIRVTTGDRIGNILRSGAQKAANNEVRQALLQTITKMLGGKDPRVVFAGNENFKWDDFGKGKPLSSRRISAIMSEVKAYTNEHNVSDRHKPYITQPDLVGNMVFQRSRAFERPTMAACEGLSYLVEIIQKTKGFDLNASVAINEIKQTARLMAAENDADDDVEYKLSEHLGRLKALMGYVACNANLPKTECVLAGDVASVLSSFVYNLERNYGTFFDRRGYESGLRDAETVIV